jgi:hypothetical protein
MKFVSLSEAYYRYILMYYIYSRQYLNAANLFCSKSLLQKIPDHVQL